MSAVCRQKYVFVCKTDRGCTEFCLWWTCNYAWFTDLDTFICFATCAHAQHFGCVFWHGSLSPFHQPSISPCLFHFMSFIFAAKASVRLFGSGWIHVNVFFSCLNPECVSSWLIGSTRAQTPHQPRVAVLSEQHIQCMPVCVCLCAFH